MKREDFKKIIKLRSFWKIDKRKGNYKLPSGEWLTHYIKELVDGQMNLDKIRIAEDGNLYFAGFADKKWIIMKPFSKNEICTFAEQWERMDKLVREMVE